LKIKSKNKRKKASIGKEYVIVAYLFVAIFVALIGYVAYFNYELADNLLASSNNTRQDAQEERIVRGSILSADGKVLAKTEVDGEGLEFRVYPQNNIFAHVVGYSNKGKSGLEAVANKDLLTSSETIIERVRQDIKEEKRNGDTVVTTLDARLQTVAYNALGGYNGSIVVMEAQTGKVLAMVSKPDFDPNGLPYIWNQIVDDKSNSQLLNRATQGMYPPGSTLKVVTALAYIKEHEGIDGFHYNCTGKLTIGEHTLRCYNNTAHGELDFTSAFARSCNGAFAQMGADLGWSKLKSTAEEMLFNESLPLTLPYYQSRFTLDNGSGVPLTMQTAIGQGNTLTTPIHMAMIAAAIANDGEAMKPYFIDHIENAAGDTTKTYKPSKHKTLMTTKESQILAQLMHDVVTQGTATALNDNAYSVAGKTGTADHADMLGPAHSWFIGYSNGGDTDIVVSIIAEASVSTGEYSVAVPIAQKIFDTYYYEMNE